MFATFDWLVIERVVVEEKTPGGIIIPDNKKDRITPFQGRVAMAGPECKYVKVDDMVSFDSKGAGGVAPFIDKIQGREYTFVREPAVMMVLNDDRVPDEDWDIEEDDGK